MKKAVCLLLIVIMITMLIIPAQATETDVYARKLLQYYQFHQEEAMPEIEHYLSIMEAEAPAEAAKWRKIMELWNWTDTRMPISEGILPAGLPEDDSLCIVVLGYALESNGSIQPELEKRLQVALASAQRYPNAWILVTGGETSHVKGVSEAGQMYQWLVNAGVDASRIIQDPDAMSTTDNARNACRILAHYPRVKTIALVTSDYHCRWGASVLAVATWLEFGEEKQLVCAAGVKTNKKNYDSYHSQASGIAQLTGVRWRNDGSPELYIPRETEATPTSMERTALPENVQVQRTSEKRVWPVLAASTAACVVGAFLMRKK